MTDTNDKIKADEKALDAFLDISETIKIGSREFTIYPISPGKLRLLTKKLEKLQPLIEILYNQKKAEKKSDSELLGELSSKFSDCLDEIAEAFNILIQPNQDKPPYIEPLTENEKEWLMFNLSIDKIARIIFIVIQQTSVVGLLKNVLTLKAPRVKPSPSSVSSVGLSSSPDGQETK